MSHQRTYKPGDAAKLDAFAVALAPSVHAALDHEPSADMRRAIRLVATQRFRSHARMVSYVWRSAVSIAAALVLMIGVWSVQRHQQSQRLQLLDHLLVLATTVEPTTDEFDNAAESLAQRLLSLQGFDMEITVPEAVEAPEPPAIDAQWRNRHVLLTKIYV